MFLDLNMPGMDGIEVLRRVLAMRPGSRVVIITAGGSVPKAVEAMKLGAADFIEKPFTPERVRDIARRVLQSEPRPTPGSSKYEACLANARRQMKRGQLELALAHLRAAIGSDPTRPEAFNHMGVVLRLNGRAREAQRLFRVAIALDPTYHPARQNLERISGPDSRWNDLDLALDGEPAALHSAR